MDLLLVLLVFVFVGVGVLAGVTHGLPSDERSKLLNILLFAFALRLAVAMLFAVVPEARVFHEDAEGYEGWGLAIADGWSSKGPPIALPWSQNYGQAVMCAVLYYLLGSVRAAPSFFNALLGTLTVFLVFKLARRFFRFDVAYRAALLTAFTPSMILWSAIAIKDPLLTFLICLSLYSCVRLKERFSLPALAGTVIPVILVQPFRFYMLYFLAFAILTSLLFERGTGSFAGVYKQIAVGGAVVVLLVMLGFAGRAEQGTDFLSLERVSSFRQGMAATAGSGFATDVDVSTPGRALAFLPFGMTVLLLGPFPWQLSSFRAAMAMPETIVWWFLFPSMIRGLRFSLRHIFTRISPVVVFASTLTAAYSLVHGNVGSGFRQRAQIFVFLFVFTAVGMGQKQLRRRRADETLVLEGRQPDPPAEVPAAQAARA
jgi:hypothetical protein